MAVLSLYASWGTTGFTLNSSDGFSHTLHIRDSRELPHAISRMDPAGRHQMSYMMAVLSERGPSFTNVA